MAARCHWQSGPGTAQHTDPISAVFGSVVSPASGLASAGSTSYPGPCEVDARPRVPRRPVSLSCAQSVDSAAISNGANSILLRVFVVSDCFRAVSVPRTIIPLIHRGAPSASATALLRLLQGLSPRTSFGASFAVQSLLTPTQLLRRGPRPLLHVFALGSRHGGRTEC